MEQLDNRKDNKCIVNKKYTSQEVDRLRKIVDYVTIESKQKNSNTDFNDWGNHSEYTRGW